MRAARAAILAWMLCWAFAALADVAHAAGALILATPHSATGASGCVTVPPGSTGPSPGSTGGLPSGVAAAASARRPASGSMNAGPSMNPFA